MCTPGVIDALADARPQAAGATGRLLGPATAAIRRYWRAFVAIQLIGLGLVAGYWTVPAVAAVLQQLAEWRERGGVLAAALAGAIAGGILPELAKLVTGIDRRPVVRRLHDVGFQFAFFAFSSFVVFHFYQLQSWLFGDRQDLATVAAKVALDQFVFTVFWATPFGLTMFSLKACGYRLGPTLATLTPRRLAERFPALLLPCWMYWLPMTSLIYSLPGALQFVLFSLALAAWSLLMVFIAQHNAAAAATGPDDAAHAA
ncbi:MAG: hypothetical protein ACK4PI_05470 [Tepidisphaerales bacterium]